MDIKYDAYGRAEPSVAYIAHPSYKKIGVLSGIQEDSCRFTGGVNTDTLSFTVDKYVDGEPSNYYKFIEKNMKLYLTGIGWFTISDITFNNNDGKNESKEISLTSIDQEFLQRDLVGFKINNGTTDSCEMLIDGNVEVIDGVEFAKKQIAFHDNTNPQYSLLQTVLNWTGMTDWNIGYIDPVPKEFTVYENGSYIKKMYTLSEQVGYFNITSENAYDFFVKDVSNYFECIITFDTLKKQINAYYAEHIGNDTNIVFGWRNLQNSNIINSDTNLFTRYTVQGGDNLNINYANFGYSQIENLDYFLNEKYMTPELIVKYKSWRSDVESKRQPYMDLTIKYNDNLTKISELQDRVPLDGCRDDLTTFSDDELQAAKDGYEAQIVGYEAYYVDANGNFDINALMACEADWNEYCQIKDVIIPNINIEMFNRNLPTSVGEKEYIDSYKTNWVLYGVSELEAKIASYQDEKKLLENGHYDIPYGDYYVLASQEVADKVPEDKRQYSGHTQSAHEERYSDYSNVMYQLSELYTDSCATALATRKAEVLAIETENKKMQTQRADLIKVYDKESWSNGDHDGFTKSELVILSKLYNDTDYTNENVIVVDNDTNTTTVNEQMRLYELAKNDLEIYSQPQYIYSTNIDNFLSMPEYKNYVRDLKLCNYIRLETEPGHFVKLRVIEITFNPFIPNDPDLQIGFSNMLRSKSGRNDINYLLDNATGGSKNSITGSSGSTNNSTETVQLTPGLLRKIFSNSASKNEITNIITSQFNTLIGKYLNVDTVDAELVKAIDVKAANGFFDYLQTELISAGKIVADSGDFKSLTALVAQIDTLLSGTISAELGHLIHLTAENVNIDEAVIRDLIAANITVSMLQAGTINSNEMNILSEDGGMSIVGNTMQFKDSNGVVRIQMGRDVQNDFTFCLYDSVGTGVLIDSTGIKGSAIGDGLIKNDMISNNSISKDKLAFKTVETNADGSVDASNVVINGKGMDVAYSTMQETVNELDLKVTSSISAVELKVDNNTSSIATKASQTDITNSINSYDNSTGKTIRDRITKTEEDITGLTSSVSDITTEVDKKADGSTVTALSERVTTAEQTASGFKQTVESTYATKTELSTDIGTVGQNLSDFQTSVSDDLEALKNQVDGSIMTWFYAYVPNNTNIPASDWNTVTLKNTHLGDLFYDTTTGYCYRYQLSDGVYSWEQVKDTDVVKAITAASKAQDTADAKRRVFVNTPKPPYDIGDLWTGGSTGELMRCKTSRASGSYVSTDWEKASKYTDDSKANQVESNLTTNYSTTSQMNSAISQEAGHINQTVSETYATKSALSTVDQKADSIASRVSTNEGNITAATQTANGIKTEIENARGDKTALGAKINEIVANVSTADGKATTAQLTADEATITASKKQDSTRTSIRYIRDWLEGNSVDTGNHWVRCRVMAGNTNIVDSLTATLIDANGNVLTQPNNIGIYTQQGTEEISSEKYVTASAGRKALQIDLGELHADIDYITIWHYYTDGRIYNHKLEVSSDKTNWTTLYDSAVQGGYKEIETGEIYNISQSGVYSQIAQLQVTATEISQAIADNSSSFNQQISDVKGNISEVQSTLRGEMVENSANLQGQINERPTEITVKSIVRQESDRLTNTITTLDGEVETLKSTVTQDSSKWLANFAKLGMEVSPEVLSTAIAMSIEGIEVSQTNGSRVLINTSGLYGTYNGVNVFQLEKDLTITDRIQIQNGADFTTLKYINRTYRKSDNTPVNCLVHVISGGTS